MRKYIKSKVKELWTIYSSNWMMIYWKSIVIEGDPCLLDYGLSEIGYGEHFSNKIIGYNVGMFDSIKLYL